MGIIKLPCRNDYWRKRRRLFSTSFGEIMARDRFNLIWRYLHLSDNTQRQNPEPDRLFKVRPYLTYLNEKFGALYRSHGDVTIDESMIKYKGRLKFLQYMPMKPTKWGIKVWAMSESRNGYLHRFQVYTGKEAGQEKGLTHRVVTELMEPFRNANIRVYMDNFYTSVPLYRELLMHRIYACGTVRSNRKELPTDLLPKAIKLNKHEYRVAQQNDLTFCTWMDTKPVLVLSNHHDPQQTGHVNRRTGQPQQQQVEVPKMLQDYQKHMGGVDRLDQLIGYYIIQHRSKKWWRRIFHYLQMASAINAYILGKELYPEEAKREWPNLQDFLEDLSEELTNDTRAKRAAPVLQERLPINTHDFEKHLFPKRKNCRHCPRDGTRVKATTNGCRQCQVPVCQTCIPKHIQGN